MQSGELDATTLTYDQVIAANARGWKLKVVMPIEDLGRFTDAGD